MSKVTYKNLEGIIQVSTERKDTIHLVEVKTDWNGCSHINAPVIQKIEPYKVIPRSISTDGISLGGRSSCRTQVNPAAPPP